jgi:hypothetical protein
MLEFRGSLLRNGDLTTVECPQVPSKTVSIGSGECDLVKVAEVGGTVDASGQCDSAS